MTQEIEFSWRKFGRASLNDFVKVEIEGNGEGVFIDAELGLWAFVSTVRSKEPIIRYAAEICLGSRTGMSGKTKGHEGKEASYCEVVRVLDATFREDVRVLDASSHGIV